MVILGTLLLLGGGAVGLVRNGNPTAAHYPSIREFKTPIDDKRKPKTWAIPDARSVKTPDYRGELAKHVVEPCYDSVAREIAGGAGLRDEARRLGLRR